MCIYAQTYTRTHIRIYLVRGHITIHAVRHTYTYTCTCWYVHMHTCAHLVSTHIYVSINQLIYYIQLHLCTCIYIPILTNMCTFRHSQVYLLIYKHVDTHTLTSCSLIHTHTYHYTYTNLYVHMCTPVYIHIPAYVLMLLLEHLNSVCMSAHKHYYNEPMYYNVHNQF